MPVLTGFARASFVGTVDCAKTVPRTAGWLKSAIHFVGCSVSEFKRWSHDFVAIDSAGIDLLLGVFIVLGVNN